MRVLLAVASIIVAGATALALLAVAVSPFLTPAFVAFEQGRADAAAWTGLPPDDLRLATEAILRDLVVGPPQFDVSIDGVPVLTEGERNHMRDVRGVFTGFYVAAAVSLVVIAAGWVAASRSARWSRRSWWIATRAGAAGLAALLVAAGVIALVAFEAAFEVFHRLFFSAGSYTFDPRTDRLVQLFPEVFWMETAIGVGAVALNLAIVAVLIASRRLGDDRRLAAHMPVVVAR